MVKDWKVTFPLSPPRGCYSARTQSDSINLPVPKQPSWCSPAHTTKNKKEERKKKSVKLKTLMASIHPNNKDILQILLAITYFTSCIKKKKEKKRNTNIRLISPPLVFLKCIGKHVYVHCGSVVSFFLFFSGWHLSSSDRVALFFFFFFVSMR